MSALDILMVVSEALPYSKTGGLGDVGGALPAALSRLGHRVTVAQPRYRGIDASPEVARFRQGAWLGSPEVSVQERQGEDGVRIWFVDCPPYFDRDGIYGADGSDYPDNDKRYGLLARAALETAIRAAWRPSVVHAHDWQTGLTHAYLEHRYNEHPLLGGVPTVFTIHNLAYQGLFPRESLPSLDLGWETFTEEGLEFWGKVSFLKAGINYASVVTTVSRRYAMEIQTAEQGFGFEGVLQRRSRSLVGIPNGIDEGAWNPATDPLLPAHFTAKDLSGKAAVKQALLARAFPGRALEADRPVIGMVSRMVDQKGLDLIEAAATDLMRLDAAFVILGTGDAKYELMWRTLALQHPDRVSVTVGFSEAMAHLIEGGADLFLMPSHFEPCGLNQMYSLRYGTIPVVRATGGLDDTVDQVNRVAGTGTGFKFGPATPGAMLAALREALATYGSPEKWRRIQRAGMRQDHSWDASARDYVRVYEGLQSR